VLQCVAVCCSVLQCVAVCCSVLQCIAVCCSVLQCVAVCCSVWSKYSTSSTRTNSLSSIVWYQELTANSHDNMTINCSAFAARNHARARAAFVTHRNVPGFEFDTNSLWKTDSTKCILKNTLLTYIAGTTIAFRTRPMAMGWLRLVGCLKI